MKKRSENYCRFYIVRHGETQWNVEHRMQGHQDSPLTKNGEAQARELGKMIGNIELAHAFSSDLLRAKRTAELIAADKDLAIRTTKLLRETSMGKYEGQYLDVFFKEQKIALEKRERLSNDEQMSYRLFDGMETYEEAASRMLTFMRETALAYLGKNVLAVSHAAIMRATLVKLGAGTNQELPHGIINNTSYAVIDCDGVDFFIRDLHNIEKRLAKNLAA